MAHELVADVHRQRRAGRAGAIDDALQQRPCLVAPDRVRRCDVEIDPGGRFRLHPGSQPLRRAKIAPMATRSAPLLTRVRRICLALPEVTERPSHRAPTFFVRDKKTFVMAWIEGHHDHHFPHLWCAAPPGAQEALVAAEPARFFRPPYVGHRGWIGLRLDVDVDWDEVTAICEDAYRVVAPKALVAQLDGRS
jgi:hypothetical protein